MIRLITDTNWQQVPVEAGTIQRAKLYGSAEARAIGLEPLGEMADKLVPEDQWKERIEEANAKKAFPIHHFERAHVGAKNQGGTNYCWAYGIASCVEAARLLQGQPFRRLAPATLGWLVGWKNRGNYLTSAIEGAKERGVASSVFARDGTTDQRSFKEGWERDALQNRPLEWFDTIGVDGRRRNEHEQVKHCVSLLLQPGGGSPLYIAYNWWRHALMMAGLIWDETQKYNLRWQAWNSHDDGPIELTGSRGVPDEAYGQRVVTFS
jgi:hypothetical protein